MKTTAKQIHIHIHDFAGHPFQAELSNELSRVGLRVTHSYFSHIGPVKALMNDVNNSGRITFQDVRLRQEYEVKNLFKRILFEFKLAGKLLLLHRRIRPNLTVFANVPLLTASIFRIFTYRSRFILWHQDIFSLAIVMRFKTKGNLHNLIQQLQSKFTTFLEIKLVHSAHHVIYISDSFAEIYNKWGIEPKRTTLIENWAPLKQFEYIPKIKKVDSGLELIYAGTLGLKHRPSILIDLTREILKNCPNSRMIVISEGDGADYLRDNVTSDLPLQVLGFLPIEVLNSRLSNADFAIMLLEPGASNFSVPSKTYSYLSAGKCVLAFAPLNNAASAAIVKAGGFVFEPTILGVKEAANLLNNLNHEKRLQLEVQARHYAEQNFKIARKAGQFLQVINSTLLN